MVVGNDDDALSIICVYLLTKAKGKKTRKKKSVWVREWIRRRSVAGAYHSLLGELRLGDKKSLKNFLRMDEGNFNVLLDKVKPFIERQSTPMRDSIPAGEKLALTLRYLASGDSFKSLEYLYRVPKNTISNFIPEVCQAIYKVLQPDYLKVPTTPEEWAEIEDKFMEKWQFPHCIGAMDGKHIAIKAPAGSGSEFFNYKKFFSIILLALVDADCQFVFVDVGANGRAGDAAVFSNSALSQALEEQTLNVPEASPLPGRHESVPRVVVGDEAFPLKSYLMKPFPSRDLSFEKKIFNYRLSRARRVSENAFGILVSRFQIFQRPLQVKPDTATHIILACIALHNFLRSSLDVTYNSVIESCSPNSDVVSNLAHQGGNRTGCNARAVRDELSDYFLTDGAVDWQWDMVV